MCLHPIVFLNLFPSLFRPQLFGSQSIIKHLFDTYSEGEEAIPKKLRGASKTGGAKGAKLIANARFDNPKMKPITLYGWEGAKFVTPVRQALNDLGLAHTFINCANGSVNRYVTTKLIPDFVYLDEFLIRKKLEAKTKGVFQVPYISDPNTGVEMFESAEIVKYLKETYTV